MNDKRRKELNSAKDHLNIAENILDRSRDDEQDALDNMPENLETSERYELMENAIEKLEDALSSINEAKEAIEEAAQKIR